MMETNTETAGRPRRNERVPDRTGSGLPNEADVIPVSSGDRFRAGWNAYWNLVTRYEDYLRGGFAVPHEPAPEPPARIVPGRSAFETRAGNTAERGGDTAGVTGERSGGGDSPRARQERLSAMAAEIAVCTKCRLCERRINTVPGFGALDPEVMVVGEGPGEEEDKTGLPFVGRAGQYLDKWLDSIGLSRHSNAFIGNVVKCRPPQNRDPMPDESDACLPYLRRQIALIRPRAILTVGRVSTQLLTGRTSGVGSLRGSVYSYEGVPLVPTYHPSGVLRNPDLRRAVWEDLKALRTLLQSLPPRGSGA
jgi:uracil-DNA glycosylase family 4